MFRGFTPAWATIDANLDAQFDALVSNNPQTDPSEEYGALLLNLELDGNLHCSLDGRICIEVGTSLPLTHSALIEDDKEKPDYSLGRFMFRSGLRVRYQTDDGHVSHEVHGPSTYELMDSEKRVLYHRLLPQEKVSVLRIQMYIRRRVYDVAKDDSRTVALPAALPRAARDRHQSKAEPVSIKYGRAGRGIHEAVRRFCSCKRAHNAHICPSVGHKESVRSTESL